MKFRITGLTLDCSRYIFLERDLLISDQNKFCLFCGGLFVQVRQFEGVDHIEEEDEARGDMLPSNWPIPWHLDRLDQHDGVALDQTYQPIGTGEGVDVYVLDSGVRYEHSEFEFRAKYAG